MTLRTTNATQNPIPHDSGAAGSVITEADVTRLPQPIGRYLSYAQVVGKHPIQSVHLEQRGAMRKGERAKWLPMTARQHFTTDPPSFVWKGTLRQLSLVTVSATDRFAEGHGTMTIKALGFIPLGTSQGPEMDEGELLRYLGESAWFPTALLSHQIYWQPIDNGSARATLTLHGATASGVFHVDALGRYTHFTADRYRQEQQQLVMRPWLGRWDDYREVNGFRIPLKAEAIWLLGSGEFSYFRGMVSAITYR